MVLYHLLLVNNPAAVKFVEGTTSLMFSDWVYHIMPVLGIVSPAIHLVKLSIIVTLGVVVTDVTVHLFADAIHVEVPSLQLLL